MGGSRACAAWACNAPTTPRERAQGLASPCPFLNSQACSCSRPQAALPLSYLDVGRERPRRQLAHRGHGQPRRALALHFGDDLERVQVLKRQPPRAQLLRAAGGVGAERQDGSGVRPEGGCGVHRPHAPATPPCAAPPRAAQRTARTHSTVPKAQTSAGSCPGWPPSTSGASHLRSEAGREGGWVDHAVPRALQQACMQKQCRASSWPAAGPPTGGLWSPLCMLLCPSPGRGRGRNRPP